MPKRILDALARHVIIPVVREADPDRARLVVSSLRRVGFRVFEITLTVPDAFSLIRELSADDDMTVGVGTVFDAENAARAAEAGASFIVSPAALADVASAAHDGGSIAILGALTPTEVVAAARSGADAVKIFPASSVGGPAHVKALKSVFPTLPLIPTGGVEFGDMLQYLSAGAHSVGLGSSLTGDPSPTGLEEAGARHLAALEAVAPGREGDRRDGRTP